MHMDWPCSDKSIVDDIEWKEAWPILLLTWGSPRKITTLGFAASELTTEYKGGASDGYPAGCIMVRFGSFGDVRRESM